MQNSFHLFCFILFSPARQSTEKSVLCQFSRSSQQVILLGELAKEEAASVRLVITTTVVYTCQFCFCKKDSIFNRHTVVACGSWFLAEMKLLASKIVSLT